MRRCMETLHYSKIKYDKIIFGEACRMIFEHQYGETDENSSSWKNQEPHPVVLRMP